MLADLFRKALAEYRATLPKPDSICFFGEEIVKRYEMNQDTLASIAHDYVVQGRELASLRARSAKGKGE